MPPFCSFRPSSIQSIVFCNLGDTEQELVVQAGAFGEHAFTSLASGGGVAQPIPGSKYFTALLPPRSTLRCTAGLRRFVNDPSYAFPWHGRTIPVPFQ